MDRFLRYFVAPTKRVDFQAQVGKSQANAVISKLVAQRYISVVGTPGQFQLTQAGVDAWQVYVGIKKP